MTDGPTEQFIPQAPPSGASPDTRGSLDEKLWRYHDRFHAGPYGPCEACANVWHFLAFEHVPPYSRNPNAATGRKG